MARGTKVARAALTPRRRRFVLEYLVDPNATQAAKRAGFSKKTAYSMGQQLLKNIEIRKLIDAGVAKRSERLELKAERIDLEISRLCYRDPKDLVDPETKRFRSLEEIPEDLRRCIAGVTVDKDGGITYRLERKGEALALACRRRGLLKDHIDVTVRTHAELMLEAVKRTTPPEPAPEGEG
jgi:phage terminase small subunit